MATAQAVLSLVCSPWQQEMDKMIAHNELEMPELQEISYDSDTSGDTSDVDSNDNEDGSGDSRAGRRAALVTPPLTKTTKKHTNNKKRTNNKKWSTKKRTTKKSPPKKRTSVSVRKQAVIATAAQQRQMAALPSKAKPIACQQQVTKDKSLSDQYKPTVVMFLNWRDNPTPKYNKHMISTQNKLYTIKSEKIVQYMQFKVYRKADSDVNDMPTQGWSSSLEFTNKTLSHFMLDKLQS